MRHEGPFFFKSEKKTDEGQLKQMRQVPENLFFFLGLNMKKVGYFNFICFITFKKVDINAICF